MTKRCRHIGTATVLMSDGSVRRAWASVAFSLAQAISAKCDGCCAQLSAGRSRGRPNALELRAAALIVRRGKNSGKVSGGLVTADEEHALVECAMLRSNPSAAAIARGMPKRGVAGWLAYEIATHDAQQAEARVAEQTRHDVAAAFVRHDALAGSAAPEQCSRCGRPESPNVLRRPAGPQRLSVAN